MVQNSKDKKEYLGTSLMVQWLRICLPVSGMKVQAQVGELRSPMPQST